MRMESKTKRIQCERMCMERKTMRTPRDRMRNVFDTMAVFLSGLRKSGRSYQPVMHSVKARKCWAIDL